MKTVKILTPLMLLLMTSLATGMARAGQDDCCGGRDGRALQSAPRHGAWQDHRPADRIEMRQDRQRDRIRQGLRSGDISRHEARRLIHEQRRIEHMQQRFMADGQMSPHEYRALDRHMDQARRHIRLSSLDNERW